MNPARSILLLLAALVFPALPLAGQSAPPPPSPPGPQQTSPGASAETQALEAESGERDITYLRSRLVFRYDFRSKVDDTTIQRFRLKALYSFGPQKRLAVAVNLPVLHKSVHSDSAGGLGDIEVQFGGVFYRSERFRTGAAVEFGLPSSSDPLLGGGTTTIKPSWGFTAVLSSRVEINPVFHYKRSISTWRGSPTHEFEPDITLNVRVAHVTWYANWDSYYLFDTGQFAQTLAIGASRRLDKQGRWIVTPYYSFPLDKAGRETQYIHKAGVDVTWYFGKR